VTTLIADTAMLEKALVEAASGVEKMLDALVVVPDGREAKVFEAMRYSLFAGGKRLRPLLVLASADIFGVDRTQALRVSAALECVHCYSLIHDDLPAMDDDDMRRGKPTLHKKYDDATAILAGDALLTLAFEILADRETHPDPYVRTELVATLAKASGGAGMVGGQMIDLLAAEHDYTEQDIFRLQHLKTGALISFAAEAGAVMAKASDQARRSLKGYAADLGIAFQIADDLFDVEGDADVVGKAVGKDASAGKATIVSMLGIERARAQAQILADQAIEHLANFDDKAAVLRAVAQFAINRRT